MFSKLHLAFLLSSRRQMASQKGFTLIELLVVLFVIGILSAMALPSFLRQANKARQTEAETYIGAINRAQQAYHMEYLIFADLADLEISVRANTDFYNYASVPEPSGLGVQTTATPVMSSIAAYSGRVWLARGTTESILCKDTSGVPPTIVGTTCP
ncbi:prepilin-type N-terminal cleavage/methylation domain-containing protein [filamentous cyanobacterium LEGE 07170]|nr:prepilin-type N-terminal cleavage/methylation domain-containing protein [filamentous cyanobacterium LEGE 07170]